MNKTTLITACCILMMSTGCHSNLSESRKFVIASDSVNISMKTVNRLYDQDIVSKQDYQAASIVFFLAIDYILEWNDNIKADIDKPDVRIKIIQLAKELAFIALGPITEVPETLSEGNVQ